MHLIVMHKNESQFWKKMLVRLQLLKMLDLFHKKKCYVRQCNLGRRKFFEDLNLYFIGDSDKL